MAGGPGAVPGAAGHNGGQPGKQLGNAPGQPGLSTACVLPVCHHGQEQGDIQPCQTLTGMPSARVRGTKSHFNSPDVIPTHVWLQAGGVTALCHPRARGWSGCLGSRSGCRGVAGRAGSQNRGAVCAPAGPGVYRQPELFTSATGPDLHHGHPDVGPAPAAPRAPQVPPGLCWEGGGAGMRDEG